MDAIKIIAQETNIKESNIASTIQLIEVGNTIPFIARYRKELTGDLDETQIKLITDKWSYLNSLNERKQEVINLIDKQGKLTDEIKNTISKATKLQEVEDIYRPFKPKKRTRAIIAKEKGLEGLAEWLLNKHPEENLNDILKNYTSELSTEDALQGAKDIVAEKIADDADIRKKTRNLSFKKGLLSVEVKDSTLDEKQTYTMYYEYEEEVSKLPAHRILAINRGEKEGVLKVKITPPADEILQIIKKKYIQGNSEVNNLLEEAVLDGYKRLIHPAVEREIRKELTDLAEQKSVTIFSENLKNLLLQPPLKDKVILGIDPAYRTGCKTAVIDETGKVLDVGVIYPTPPKKDIKGSKKIIKNLVEKFNVDVIAIGNGTASRESELFVADTIKEIDKNIMYAIISEDGASVYSASKLGRDEFPDLAVEERSAISIARRLQDAMSEIVKIDPKSIGVGQYQHDIAGKKLNESLKFVVETAVNRVGVDVNTASSFLLQHIAGLSKPAAESIAQYRKENGRYLKRTDLKKVPKIGDKAFEQSIGFLRISNGSEPLDKTSIHPENYDKAKALLKHIGCNESDIGSTELKEKLKSVDFKSLSEELGEFTARDIVDALINPGRDPRDELSKPLLRADILEINDIKPGMKFQGTVKNVVDFGAFVDIGIKRDGLVHISKMSTKYVSHPLNVVSVGDIVTVWVDDVDYDRGRVSLSMLEPV